MSLVKATEYVRSCIFHEPILTTGRLKVIATVRALSKFPQALREAGAKPLILDLDASDSLVQHAAEDAIQLYGQVDVLVNNAGTNLTGYGPVEETRCVAPHVPITEY